MQDVVATFARIGRRGWLGTVLCVVVCAYLASRIAANLIEAAALTDAEVAPAVPRVAAAAPPPVAPPRPSGDAVVTRNMFCSDCTPAPLTAPGPMVAGDAVPLTSLPLVLIATTLGHEPVASVRDDRSGSQGAFGEGDPLPGAGAITHIGATYVDFENPAAHRVERLSLRAAAVAQAPPPAAAAAPAEAPASPYADRVRKVDDTHFEVQRGLVRDLVGAASKPQPGMRVMPMSKDGKLTGVRVAAARPDSVAGLLGLKPGDQLAAVNGIAIDSLDRMLEVYSKLDDLNHVTIEGTRAGKPLALDYVLR